MGMQATPAKPGIFEFQWKLKQDTELPVVHHFVRLNDQVTNKPLHTADNLPDKKDFKWSEIFDNDQPVEVEIGAGKGGFIAGYAPKHPELNLVAAEIETKWGKYIGSRVVRNSLENVRVVRGDFFYFLRDYIATASVKAFHMYFPDPWPKDRHRKRRLISEAFLKELHRAVKPGEEAVFHWGTDYQEYNETAVQEFKDTGFMECIVEDAPPTDGVMTNFEAKYRKEGRPIYRSIWKFIHK